MTKDVFLRVIKPYLNHIGQDEIAVASMLSRQTVNYYVTGNAKVYTRKTMTMILSACKDIAKYKSKQLHELANY